MKFASKAYIILAIILVFACKKDVAIPAVPFVEYRNGFVGNYVGEVLVVVSFDRIDGSGICGLPDTIDHRLNVLNIISKTPGNDSTLNLSDPYFITKIDGNGSRVFISRFNSDQLKIRFTSDSLYYFNHYIKDRNSCGVFITTIFKGKKQ